MKEKEKKGGCGSSLAVIASVVAIGGFILTYIGVIKAPPQLLDFLDGIFHSQPQYSTHIPGCNHDNNWVDDPSYTRFSCFQDVLTVTNATPGTLGQADFTDNGSQFSKNYKVDVKLSGISNGGGILIREQRNQGGVTSGYGAFIYYTDNNTTEAKVTSYDTNGKESDLNVINIQRADSYQIEVKVRDDAINFTVNGQVVTGQDSRFTSTTYIGLCADNGSVSFSDFSYTPLF